MSPYEMQRGIAVGVDDSSSSTAAVAWAAHEAEMHNVPLHLVHGIAPLPVADGWSELPVAEYSKFQEDQARHLLEQAHKVAVEATTPGALRVTSEVLRGPVVPGLVDLSRNADLVVVGCRGEGAVAGAVLGSVSSGLVHHAHCPVAVIHDDAGPVPRSPQAPVVVGIDGSPTSELATEIAFDEASRRGVNLVAVHAWTDMGPLEFPRTNWAPIEWRNYKERAEEVLSERLCGYQDRYPDVAVRKVVVSDRPAPRLLEQAQNAQLVVVGSHGRGGFSGMLLGSVGRAVVHLSRVPVIVARTPADH